MFAKDIGHFEPMFFHLLLPSPSVVRSSRIAGPPADLRCLDSSFRDMKIAGRGFEAA